MAAMAIVESTGRAATRRNLGRPWQKGQSGNPGGKAKGLGAYVRGKTKDGKELADFYLDIMRVSGQFAGSKIPLTVRMDAARELMDRAYGKPTQALEHTGEDGGAIQVEERGILSIVAVDYRQAIAPLLAPPVDE